jgi:hypothetical protein
MGRTLAGPPSTDLEPVPADGAHRLHGVPLMVVRPGSAGGDVAIRADRALGRGRWRGAARRRSALVPLLAALGLAAVGTSEAAARTTLACFPSPRAAPSTCTVYALPGRVVGPATANGVVRVRLTRIRWSGWGGAAATGRARLRVDGRLRSVRLRASGRQTSGAGSSYYTRLRITRDGRSQTVGLDSSTEVS